MGGGPEAGVGVGTLSVPVTPLSGMGVGVGMGGVFCGRVNANAIPAITSVNNTTNIIQPVLDMSGNNTLFVC